MKSVLMTSVASLAFATPALAETATNAFQVTATVADSCTVAATNLAFGLYDPSSGSALNGISTITAICTQGTTYDIGLNVGDNNANTTSLTRAMTDGSNYLDYELYSDVSRSNVWGDTGGGNTVSNINATGGPNAEIVYGEIPAAQYVPAGAYVDNITVTLTY